MELSALPPPTLNHCDPHRSEPWQRVLSSVRRYRTVGPRLDSSDLIIHGLHHNVEQEGNMGTTTFFEETVHDKEKTDITVDLELGRSSFYHGENLIYLKIDDKSLILDEATGKRLVEAMGSVGRYLGYQD